jgi:dual specificity protein kinase YAK1
VGKQTHEFYRVGFNHHGRKTYDLKSMEQYATEHRTNEQPSKQYFKQTKLDDIIMQYAYSKKNPKPSDMEKGELLCIEASLPLDLVRRLMASQGQRAAS